MEGEVGRFGILLVGLSVASVGCQGTGSQPAGSTPGPQSAAAAAQPSAIPAAAVKPPDALASHNTNWAGVVADVTILRRTGNTLTAMIRLRNNLQQTAVVGFNLGDVYLLDAPRGRKYLVLKDERDAFIGSQTATQGFGPNTPLTMWMKFPAPPADVTALTLVVPHMPPFEDLPIEG